MVLSKIDKLIVQCEGVNSGSNSMLNDAHIGEFNDILKVQSNGIMQPTLLLQRPCNILPIPI